MTSTTSVTQRVLTEAQYRGLVQREGARLHPSSRRTQQVLFLPRRNAWMTARAGHRRGTVQVRFYARCPCEEPAGG